MCGRYARREQIFDPRDARAGEVGNAVAERASLEKMDTTPESPWLRLLQLSRD
jgi:hypothetical protein